MHDITIALKFTTYGYDEEKGYHREDGPALEDDHGGCYWALYGKFYHKQDYFKTLAKIRGQEWADKIRLIYA